METEEEEEDKTNDLVSKRQNLVLSSSRYAAVTPRDSAFMTSVCICF